jgi:GNAT superfamily N-acetyltransferase
VCGSAERGFETLGVVRAVADPDNICAEFAIIVRSDIKRKGIGDLLMRKMIDYLRLRGTRTVVGETLPYNNALLQLAFRFGFKLDPATAEDTLRLALPLNQAAQSGT